MRSERLLTLNSCSPNHSWKDGRDTGNDAPQPLLPQGSQDMTTCLPADTQLLGDWNLLSPLWSHPLPDLPLNLNGGNYGYHGDTGERTWPGAGGWLCVTAYFLLSVTSPIPKPDCPVPSVPPPSFSGASGGPQGGSPSEHHPQGHFPEAAAGPPADASHPEHSHHPRGHCSQRHALGPAWELRGPEGLATRCPGGEVTSCAPAAFLCSLPLSLQPRLAPLPKPRLPSVPEVPVPCPPVLAFLSSAPVGGSDASATPAPHGCVGRTGNNPETTPGRSSRLGAGV